MNQPTCVIPIKVRTSLADDFGRKAEPLVAASGWVWNLGGPEGNPSSDRIAAVVLKMLEHLRPDSPPGGYGKIEVGCTSISDSTLVWVRLLGLDLVEARWYDGATDTRPPCWAKVHVKFPKIRIKK